jgi:mono/diheme cytochrome c family protein
MLIRWALLLTVPLAAQPDFRATVWPVLEKAQCRQCHNDNGVASTTRLQFPGQDAADARIQAFGLSLRRLVDASRPEESPLLRKPSNRTAHGGGERIRQGSPEEHVLREWVRYLATLPESVAAASRESTGPSKPVLRRLTHAQYNYTVRDLLGEETRPADAFPKEDFVNGFTNQAEGQSVSPLLAEAYSRAAERLARNAFGKGDRRGLIGCPPSDSCRDEFLRRMGLRAFRRPLTSAEEARYRKLFAREPDFLKGAQIVTEAMLQSPNFLFHLEPGAYGIASRLSYFLWDTMPDDTLFAAARSGELETQAGIEKQVRRMLGDPRAITAFDGFLAQWLRFDRLRGALRDRNLFPEYSPELVENMIEETTRLFRHAAWSDTDFLQFFTAGYSFLTTDLARLYGMSPPPEPWARVAFPAAHPRAGVLGQASFLTLTSKPADTSPTERGLFIREHFLCQIVPPPPAGVSTTLPPVTDEKPVTQRERLQIHLSNQVCAGCHSLVDPIGFGFEKFDAIGRYREAERVLIHPTVDEIRTRRKTKPTEYNLPIQAQGMVRGLSDAGFTSPRELGLILAKEPACQRCIVKQLFRYAAGRPEAAEDQPVIERAFQRFRDSRFRFSELIMAIASSETFRGGL